MLTSLAQAENAERCRRIGVDACLTKPVKHSDLLDALTNIFGAVVRRQPEQAAYRPRLVPKKQLRVLVAEDNPVNRKLVVTLLQKRGHEVRAVEDGRAAVNAVASASPDGFDVAVMDVQMPVLSGLEATRAIRASEQSGAPRLPIVALTAHAMQGDRERCLAAGMDDYLPKPIDIDDLIATVERFGDGRTTGAGPRPAGEPAAADEIFDEQNALAYTGGDRALLKEIIDVFRQDYPSGIRRLEGALKRRDAAAVRMAAHALKGSIATVGSPAGRQTAFELEQMGRTKQLASGGQVLARLRQQLQHLEAAFAAAGLVERARTQRTRGRHEPVSARKTPTKSKRKPKPKTKNAKKTKRS
jgi:two-component system sensor histidine kinase/response regulator